MGQPIYFFSRDFARVARATRVVVRHVRREKIDAKRDYAAATIPQTR
jgi:hypothetical protein